MREHSAIVMAVLLVTSMVAVPIAGLAATGEVGPVQTDDTTANETATNDTDVNDSEANASVAPGERFAGVVGVQEAELEGEVDERSFGIQVAQAASNDSKAAVVGDQLADVEQRLDRLEQRKQALQEARANGSISEGQYRAEMSELAAQTQTVERLANQSANVSQGLPADVLEANGVNVTAIQTLQERANELSGPEVAEIARSIAGPNVGTPAGDRGPGATPERPGQNGPGERPDGQPSDQSGDQTPDDETATDDGTDQQRPGGERGDRTPSSR